MRKVHINTLQGTSVLSQLDLFRKQAGNSQSIEESPKVLAGVNSSLSFAEPSGSGKSVPSELSTSVQHPGAKASSSPYVSDISSPASTADGACESGVFDAMLALRSPFDFLCFFDEEINSGRVVLYPWQLEILEEFVKENFTKDHPYEGAKACCNGSGKDKYIIAPFAVWFLCTKKKSRTIITTASGNQLTTQTEPYIRQLCEKVNSFFGKEFIEIKQRHMYCPETKSEICLFATDEGYKAEGFHPWEPDSEMALIINEAKGVLPEIFEALERCTGYNYNLMVSSPGQCTGNFYNYYLSNIPRTHKITAFMCPHIPKDTIEKTATLYGKDSALYRSKILAEFTNYGGMTVISEDDYMNCLKNKDFQELKKEDLYAGLDSAKGGDETVLSVWRGNRQISIEHFQCRDITVEADILVELFRKYKLRGENINSDDGGIGGGLNDILHRKGFYVNRVLNQSSALDTSAFQNRGAELYFAVNRLLQEKIIMPLGDERQKQQLLSRKYKKSEALGKICLQSKKEARSEGQHSPDRADAMVLALAGKSIYDFLGGQKSSKTDKKTAASIISTSISSKKPQGLNIVEGVYQDPYTEFDAMLEKKSAVSRCFGSISRIFKS